MVAHKDDGEWDGPEEWDEEEQAWVRYRIFGDVRVRVLRYRKPGGAGAARTSVPIED